MIVIFIYFLVGVVVGTCYYSNFYYHCDTCIEYDNYGQTHCLSNSSCCYNTASGCWSVSSSNCYDDSCSVDLESCYLLASFFIIFTFYC
jgi:hypothetical protein